MVGGGEGLHRSSGKAGKQQSKTHSRGDAQWLWLDKAYGADIQT